MVEQSLLGHMQELICPIEGLIDSIDHTDTKPANIICTMSALIAHYHVQIRQLAEVVSKDIGSIHVFENHKGGQCSWSNAEYKQAYIVPNADGMVNVEVPKNGLRSTGNDTQTVRMRIVEGAPEAGQR